MASMNQPTTPRPLPLIARQRVTLLLLLVVGLAAAGIAIAAVQRQSAVPVVPAVVPVVQAPAPGVPAPVLDRTAIIDTYEQLHLQRLAAEQALRAGNTENYEIAVSGAEALQSRIADLRAQQPRD